MNNYKGVINMYLDLKPTEVILKCVVAAAKRRMIYDYGSRLKEEHERNCDARDIKNEHKSECDVKPYSTASENEE